MLGFTSAGAWGAKRMSETTGAYDGGAVGARSGVMAGTRVATALGWRSIDGITEGDLVLTFDAGLQRVTKVTRETVWDGFGACPQRLWPLFVPAGALGNRDELYLLPHQYVMIESDAAEDLFGDPFSLIMANALDGVNGIEALPPRHGMEAIVLHFEAEQVIFADSGVLYYCPSACGLLDQAMSLHSGPPYKALTEEDAEVLVLCIESERATDKVWAHSMGFAPACAVA